MLNPITIEYEVSPKRRSLAAGQVADLFGLAAQEPPHVIAKNLILDIRPGDLALFTGPSGSGKSSLLREAGRQLGAVDAMALELPEVPLVEALPGTLESRLNTLAMCGLSEARLMLRTPAELSDGQRYRFRIAYACCEDAHLRSRLFKTILLDEYTAILDRTLAKVVSYNLRKYVSRTNITVLAATTHEDIIQDLNPNLHIRCDGTIDVQRTEVERREFSLAGEMTITDGTAADWPYFAQWHYRSHHLAFTRKIVLLRYREEPVGICVFAAPAASLTLRSRYFGLTNPRSRVALAALNQQLWLLSRVVLHPTWRGAGLAAKFVREACARCPVPWIETLSAMGQVNPFFEKAGFVRVGIIRKTGAAYFGRSAESQAKSRHSEPVYYVFDNRKDTH